MIPRLHIQFPCKQQRIFWGGVEYTPASNEYLINHARTGIVIALQTALPQGGRVGVVAYNCHTVANAVVQGGCTPVFIDVTPDLHIDLQHLAKLEVDAIVVTNLFGIRNDIEQIRQSLPNAIIIVDNAHGYGLSVEGDFCVYSINQGKFPSLGEGGLLFVQNAAYQSAIRELYKTLPAHTRKQEIKLFAKMLAKALLYHPCIYGITMRGKKQRSSHADQSKIILRRMPKGVSRMYQHYLASDSQAIQQQLANASQLRDTLLSHPQVQEVFWGENAFMAIARCQDVAAVQQWFASRGIETATHFSHAIHWAQEFGYQPGSSPMAEKLTKELLMIPTYVRCTV